MVNLQEKEFFCNTCKVNNDLETLDQIERSQAVSTPEKKKNFYIPMRRRRTSGVGLVFTAGSIIYDWHINHGSHHEWGNVAEEEAKIEEDRIQESIQTDLERLNNL